MLKKRGISPAQNYLAYFLNSFFQSPLFWLAVFLPAFYTLSPSPSFHFWASHHQRRFSFFAAPFFYLQPHLIITTTSLSSFFFLFPLTRCKTFFGRIIIQACAELL